MKPLKILFAAILAVTILSSTAMADNDILTGGARPPVPPTIEDVEILGPSGTLEATLADPIAGMEGVVFDIWYIADHTNSFTEDFANSGISINFQDSSHWLEDAEALEAYARAESVKTYAKPSTVSGGSFRIDKLPAGTYLIAAQDFIRDNVKYEIQAFLLPVPCMGSFEVTATIKAKASPLPPKEYVARRVIKTWKNDSPRVRPKEITVELLRDGKVFETVKLSKDNNWRYTWEKLENTYDWSVREKDVPPQYSTRTKKDGITFQLINVRKSPESDYDPPYRPPVPSNPDTPWTPTPSTPIPSNPGTPTSTPGLVDIDDNQVPLGPLPQAGANWLPVLALAFIGLLFVLAAFIPVRPKRK